MAARIAMFSKGTQQPRKAAHVRKFSLPQLLDTDRASKDEKTEREVDGLRTMKRAGTGSVALTRTHAFGGDGGANVVNEIDETRAGVSLQCLSILERYRKKN